MSWKDSVMILVIWMTVYLCPAASSSECPGNVQKSASACFDNYKSHYVNMKKRENTLFTGVDSELLRSFCSSYNEAMKCITSLKEKCSSNSNFQINSTLADFEVAVEELSDLCRDDVIYEEYARQRSCLEENKAYSMRCYDNIMKTSVRLSRRTGDLPLAELCSDMNKLLNCIGNNIQRNCGQEAHGLVDRLVKPMVKRSSQCDRYYKTTPRPVTHHASAGKSRDNNSYNVLSNKPFNSAWTTDRYHLQCLVSLLCLICVVIRS